MNHELFAWVTSAHDILSNDEKKKTFFDTIKQKEAERQLLAEDYVTEARAMMNRGKFSEALSKISEAKAMYSSEMIELNYLWAKFKTPGKMTPEAMNQADLYLKGLSSETKKGALYFFVKGLFFAAVGQNVEAADYYGRALKIDAEFAEARREYVSVKGTKKSATEELLHGDITAVFNNVFKRKKSG